MNNNTAVLLILSLAATIGAIGLIKDPSAVPASTGAELPLAAASRVTTGAAVFTPPPVAAQEESASPPEVVSAEPQPLTELEFCQTQLELARKRVAELEVATQTPVMIPSASLCVGGSCPRPASSPRYYYQPRPTYQSHGRRSYGRFRIFPRL